MIRHYADTPVTELPEGVERRVLNRGGALMLVEFRFEDSTPSPPHAHLHEQIGIVREGRFEVCCGDERRECGPGDSYYVPPNVEHGVRLLTKRGAILDAFTPQREDFVE